MLRNGTRLLWKLPKVNFNNVRYSSEGNLGALPSVEDRGFQSKVTSHDYKTVSHHLLHGHKTDLEVAHEQGSTMASCVVPEGSYEEHFKKNNSRWNMYMAASIAVFGATSVICYNKGVFFSNEFPISEWKKVKIDLNEKPFDIEYAEIDLNDEEEKLLEQYSAEMVPWAVEKFAGIDMPDDVKEKLIKSFVSDMFVVDTGYA